MPSYDYSCSKCEHTFEKILTISNRLQPEAEPCPACASENSITQQILQAPGLANSFRLGKPRHDSGFKEVMEKMHAGVAGSKLKNSDSSLF